MGDLFSEKLAAWREYTETPWARLRYSVVEKILQLQAAQMGGSLRVLDVGGGDGMDALPLALAGHHVTVVDPSTPWLAEAQRRAKEAGVVLNTIEAGLDDLPEGQWDLVLCHFVLRYRPNNARDIKALASRTTPGGRLSVMDVNPDGRVLRELLNGGPAAALAELRSERAKVETFQTDARKVRWEDVEEEGLRVGLKSRGLFGNRIVNDLLADNEAKHDPAFYSQLLELELSLHDREPFNRMGFAWQLILDRV